jgi:hypothetical protein
MKTQRLDARHPNLMQDKRNRARDRSSRRLACSREAG